MGMNKVNKLTGKTAVISPNKPRTAFLHPGTTPKPKQRVIELINSTGLVAIDLGSLRTGGAMHEIGAPLSGVELHFVRRLHRV